MKKCSRLPLSNKRLLNKQTAHQAPGFSLIELMVVIAIIALVCSMSMVIHRSMYRVTARSEVELLHTTLHYLRARALATGMQQTLTFDLAHNSYSFDTVTHTLASNIAFSCDQSIHGPPSDPKAPITTCCSFKDAQVRITADGVASSGAIYLTDEVSSRVYAVTNAVAHYSFFRKYEYDKGWHFLE